MFQVGSNLISGFAKNAIMSKGIFKRWNENEPSCKKSATKWPQVPCRHPITWTAKTVKVD